MLWQHVHLHLIGTFRRSGQIRVEGERVAGRVGGDLDHCDPTGCDRIEKFAEDCVDDDRRVVLQHDHRIHDVGRCEAQVGNVGDEAQRGVRTANEVLSGDAEVVLRDVVTGHLVEGPCQPSGGAPDAAPVLEAGPPGEVVHAVTSKDVDEVASVALAQLIKLGAVLLETVRSELRCGEYRPVWIARSEVLPRGTDPVERCDKLFVGGVDIDAQGHVVRTEPDVFMQPKPKVPRSREPAPQHTTGAVTEPFDQAMAEHRSEAIGSRDGARFQPVTSGNLYITGDAASDELLNNDANALLIGMLLDQQVPMEWAFAGPTTLLDRLGHLDPAEIAAMDLDEFVTICCDKPAIHRFPGSMGKRIHQMCAALVEDYDGDARNIWRDVDSGREIYRRLKALPGYGDEKSKIFVAILAKTQNVQPDGWRDAAGKFGDDVPRSVADIHDEASLATVREWKKAQKTAKKDKQDNPIADHN